MTLTYSSCNLLSLGLKLSIEASQDNLHSIEMKRAEKLYEEQERRVDEFVRNCGGEGDLEITSIEGHNSGNVLSGLLICEECGSPCRRITRVGGEIVWRCANRVEHGKAYCKNSVTVTDAAVKKFLCRTLDMPVFGEQMVRNSIESIIVRHEL